MSAPASTNPIEPTIALVFSPEPWVEDLHRHLSDHGGARVRQIVLEPSVALEEEYDTLVVSHRWPALGKPLVDSVHGRGRHILGVFGADEPGGREYLLGLGADAVVAAESAPSDFVDVLVALGSGPGARLRLASEPALVGAPAAPHPTSAGVVTAVAGPHGAGATEVAIELARALAHRGHDTSLVDADHAHASIAVRLALPIEPNLRTAVDAVEYGEGNLAAALVSVGPGRLRVLCGMPSADAGANVQGREVLDVLHTLGRSHDHVVTNVSGVIRDGVPRAVVAAAGAVVGVGAGTPVGISRLLAWIADLRSVAPRVSLHLVVNCAPGDRFRRAEIATEIARTIEPASLVFVPFDRRIDSAVWDGALLTRGSFANAVEPLVDVIGPKPGLGRVSERRRTQRRALAMASRHRAASPGRVTGGVA